MSKTALLFAGQGSQTVGMGRDLCGQFEVCARLYTRANEILDRDLQKICFEGPVELLTQTDNAQPAIFLTSLACWEALKTKVPDLQPEGAAGLSLGELTALTVAKALRFDFALRLVQTRGRFMQEACDTTRGSMASIIGMDEAPLATVCRESGVDIANINCPGQIVISGDKEKVGQAVERAKTCGAKRAIPLTVAGAYHSRLMAGARQKLASALATFPLRDPDFPVVSNVTARPGANVADIRDLLARQVTSSVRWSESMQWLIGQGFTRFIELGPGTVLSGLMKRINSTVEMITVNDGPSLEAAAAKLRG